MAPLHEISALGIELDDAIIPVTIGHENIAIAGHRRIRRPVEGIWPGTGKATGTQPEQDPALGIKLGHRVAKLAIIIGAPQRAVRRRTKSVGRCHPVTAKGGNQIARGIKLQHRRFGTMERVDKAFPIDGDIGNLAPLDAIGQGLGPIRIQHVFLGITSRYD